MVGAMAKLASQRRRALGLMALLWAAALAACGPALPYSEPHPLLQQIPKAHSHPGLDGGFVEVPAAGKVTLVDFWSTSCEPCLRLMPSFQALWQEHRRSGLVVIGVAVDDNPGLVQNRLNSMNISYPNVLDDDAGTLRGAYRVSEVPRSLLFDRHGRLRMVRSGSAEDDAAELRQGVLALLAE